MERLSEVPFESLRWTYPLVNILLLITGLYVSWHTFGMRRKVFWLLSLKAAIVLGVIWISRSWTLMELDWLLTTPLTVFILFVMAFYPLPIPTWSRWFPWLWCSLMVGNGVLARLNVASLKWFWFSLSAVSMLVVMNGLWQKRSNHVHASYTPLVIFTSGTWMLFPLVWIIGPNGMHRIAHAEEQAIFTGLDLVAKGGFFIFAMWLMRGDIADDFQQTD
jgi:hypothetical protein